MIRMILFLLFLPATSFAQKNQVDSVALQIEGLSQSVKFFSSESDSLPVMVGQMSFKGDTIVMTNNLVAKGETLATIKYFIPVDKIVAVKSNRRPIWPNRPESFYSFVITSDDYHRAFRVETTPVKGVEFTHVASFATQLAAEEFKLQELVNLTNQWVRLMRR